MYMNTLHTASTRLSVFAIRAEDVAVRWFCVWVALERVDGR